MRDITVKDGFSGRYLYPPSAETLLYARDSRTVFLQTHNDGVQGVLDLFFCEVIVSNIYRKIHPVPHENP